MLKNSGYDHVGYTYYINPVGPGKCYVLIQTFVKWTFRTISIMIFSDSFVLVMIWNYILYQASTCKKGSF